MKHWIVGLLLMATPAFAGEIYLYPAAAEFPSGTVCSPQVTTSSTNSYVTVDCPQNGADQHFLFHAAVPHDMNNSFQFVPTLYWKTTANSATGNVCWDVQFAVVTTASGLRNYDTLELSAASTPNVVSTLSTASDLTSSSPASTGLIKEDDTGCDSTCLDKPLIVWVTRLASGSCTSDSANVGSAVLLRLHY